jgi:hypothetical protein
MDVSADLSLMAVAGTGGVFICYDAIRGQPLFQDRARTGFCVQVDPMRHRVWFGGRRHLAAFDVRAPSAAAFRPDAVFGRTLGRVLRCAGL